MQVQKERTFCTYDPMVTATVSANSAPMELQMNIFMHVITVRISRKIPVLNELLGNIHLLAKISGWWSINLPTYPHSLVLNHG